MLVLSKCGLESNYRCAVGVKVIFFYNYYRTVSLAIAVTLRSLSAVLPTSTVTRWINGVSHLPIPVFPTVVNCAHSQHIDIVWSTVAPSHERVFFFYNDLFIYLFFSLVQELEFDWDETTQGLVLASFFWGYVVTQMPGGMFADKYGGKATLGLGMLCSSIGTIVTPYVARSYGSMALIVLRLIIGLSQVRARNTTVETVQYLS